MITSSLRDKEPPFISHTANNYSPLPVKPIRGLGSWVYDRQGRRYFDCLSCYSAINFGHNHPTIKGAHLAQLEKISQTSLAVEHELLDPFCEAVAKFAHLDTVLTKNSGAEADETAIKVARKWGYVIKGIPRNKANIIVCENNFHGRTTTIVGFSSSPQYRESFGPYANKGFKRIPFNDLNALRDAIDENTAAFLVEPIQGEAGVVIPESDYLYWAAEICEANDVLLILDEVQTGFGRAGYDLAHFAHPACKPDIVTLGKALGGGISAVSAVAARAGVMGLIEPGDDGSTFGGNPLACAVGLASIDLMSSLNLSNRSLEFGEPLLTKLQNSIFSPKVKEVRGRGLMIGIELHEKSEMKKAALLLLANGIIVGQSHNVLRINAPLVTKEEDFDWLGNKLTSVINSL